MSDLKDRITKAMHDAMRARDKVRLGAVRLILAEVKRIEVDERIDPDDLRILSILDKMLKQRRDSISQFEKAGRQDLVAIEQGEVAVIQEFMPSTLDATEIQSLVEQAITETGAASMKEMGQVMGWLKPKVQGRADMGEISQIIKSRLS